MKLKKIISLAVAAMIAVCSSSAYAGVSDIYVSFANVGDGGAAGNTAAEFEVGTSGSAFVWVDENFSIDTGAFLDVMSSNTNVLEFTGAEVFNPDILLFGTTPLDSRWQSAGEQGVSAGLIDELNGFAVTEGTGIIPTNVPGVLDGMGLDFVDDLYDASSNGFLFARIDFDVVGVGNATISLATGDGLVVNNDVELSPSYGAASVTGTAIPEPTSATILALGLAGLVTRRRR